MTANEVIGYLECFKDWNMDDLWLSNDDMENFVEYCTKAIKEIHKYRAIGTVEECREAVEKQKPKKPILRNDNGRLRKACPVCGCFFSPLSRSCPKCGQAILQKN